MWAIPTSISSALEKIVKSPSIWSGTPNSVRIRQSGRTGNRGVTKLYFDEFIGQMGSKFEYTYFKEICFPRILVYQII